MDKAAQAEKRRQSLPHRGEIPQCWERPSEIAGDAALSSWPGRCLQLRGQLFSFFNATHRGLLAIEPTSAPSNFTREANA